MNDQERQEWHWQSNKTELVNDVIKLEDQLALVKEIVAEAETQDRDHKADAFDKLVGVLFS